MIPNSPPNPFWRTEEQFRLLVDCVTDFALFFLDPAGHVAGWNAGAERLLGYKAEEIIGQSVRLFYTPEDVRAGVPDEALRAAQESGRASDDRWQVRKDGTRFWAGGTTTALYEESGGLRGFARVLRDRTGQRAAEDALRAGERRYRALVENAWDGVTLVAADGTILETSTITFRGLGYSPEEYLGRNGFDLLHPEDVPRVHGLLAQALRQRGTRFTTEYRLRHKDGSWRWVEAAGVNLLDEPGVGAVVVNHRDVTQRKLNEQEREALLAELDRMDRSKDDFLAMLAHELRNPLSPVLHGIHILRRSGGDRGVVEQTTGMIERQVRHLARLVDDLLDVSRVRRSPAPLMRERLDLARLVRTTAADYRRLLEQAGLTLLVEVPETPAWVQGDATRLTQMLTCLLDNAGKFTPRGGHISVRLAADAERRRAVLSVRDTGVGIEPQMLPLLFKPFSQADKSLHRSQGGLGLGLALVKGLAERHGGEVEARSEGPGRGAEFRVTMPLEGEPPALAPGSPAGGPAVRGLRVLVIEDNCDAAESLRLLLELLGHQVRVTHAGPEGVEAAKAWSPSVVLSDIGLPGLDGFGVARELRRFPATARARLIAVTGYGSDEDKRRAVESGFDEVLVKPADPAHLQELLAAPLPPEAIHAGRPGPEDA